MSSTSQETAKVGCAHKGLPYTSSPLLGPPAHPVVRAGRFCESDWVAGGRQMGPRGVEATHWRRKQEKGQEELSSPYRKML